MTVSNAVKVKAPVNRIINRGLNMTKEERLSKELKKCAGKYVAVKDYKVIGCANTPEKVKAIAEKKHITNAAIFSVPDPKLGHYLF